jgi:hypothetical protein
VKRAVAAALLFCSVLGAPVLIFGAPGQQHSYYGGSTVIFASVEQGQEILASRDDFLNNLSTFDKRARVGTEEQVSMDAFISFLRGEVRQWENADRKKITAILEEYRSSLRRHRVRLPEQLYFVTTSGNEEGRAAYCRRSTVVLPRQVLNKGREELTDIVLHELFHIFSRENPEARKKLYQLIGYRQVPALQIPESLEPIKITNPDAPLLNAAVEFPHGDRTVQAVPVLYADQPYSEKRGGPFFRYLQFRLMEVEVREEASLPRYVDGSPHMIDPRSARGYFQTVGMNTGYVIHPEEVLADNFVLMIRGRGNLRSPWVVEGMREIFLR